MISLASVHERVYRWLLHLYPTAFRARFTEELVQLFTDQLRDAKMGREPAGTAKTWLKTLGDLAVTATTEDRRKDRAVAHSLAIPPSMSSRMLGLAGILGGAVLLAAFVVDIAPDFNNVRIALYYLGAIAIAAGVHRSQASVAPGLSGLVTTAAILLNAASLVWLVLSFGRLQPFAGDFGWIGFWISVATWMADAAFGLVTLRLGVVARWGALALAIGSVLAIAGIDRLELTSAGNPTIFGTIALAGVVLNGLGWILLGLEVATRHRNPSPKASRPNQR